MDKVANIFKYEYINKGELDYADELDFNIKMFSKFVSEKLDNTKEKIYEYISSSHKIDIF